MLFRIAASLPLFMLPLAGQPLTSSAAGGISVSKVSHGVRVTLTVPQSSYPRNALIEVAVRVTNVSSHAIGYFPGSICGSNPQVTVTNARDIVEYPPAIGGAPIPSCGPAIIHLPQLRPGATHLWHLYAILGGAHVQSFISLTKRQIWAYSPAVTVHLTPGSTPVATLQTTPTVTLRITPPGPTSGPLLYSSWWGCKVPRGAEFGGNGIGWQTAAGDTITPGWSTDCGNLREWHVVAGWVGQRIVTVNVGKHVTP